ncbi:two-component sensor histidine kinase [Brumimicrobium salinarum]|uniref:histidine kinase n=1 Tax=Brumimicrobium salinarum TaxID=2058658 RepID=A0A2I0R0Z8_9FLAO|nr:ATP-binding protein [Brumimicrobium salinarum]PKR80237.1 two-component sensor histidine kinase [Brumimicrobium salinarum]
MRNIKPVHILLIGAIAQIVFVAVLLMVYSTYVVEVSFFYQLIIAVASGLLSFGLGYILLKYFIEDRIQSIYKIIDHGSTVQVAKPKINLNEDIIDKVADESMLWAEERNKEILKLKEQAAFRREFLGNLAHELKTPVFSIQGYILTLLEGGLEDEKVNRKFLERASFATERMTEILEDLDQIMNLEVNKVALKITSFDIVKLTQDIINSFEEQFENKSIIVKLERKYDPIYVLADRPKIAQVFSNLIANSINYSKENGATVIRFEIVNQSLITEVSDNGIGIREKDLPRLFERFYRVEQSRNRNDGGSGLGLAICKHIIESHNETITVKSEFEKGSTFSFSLKLGSKPV